MKRPFRLLGLLSLILLAVSCTGERFDELDRLDLSPSTSVQSRAEATEVVVGVETNHSKWAATSKASWLTATPVGNSLVLQLEANPSLVKRATQVVVTAGGITKTLDVEQAGQSKLLFQVVGAEDGVLRLSKLALEYKLLVKTNASDWTVSSDATWLTGTAQPASGELIVSVTENSTTATRTATLTLSAQGKSTQIQVRQEGVLHFLLPHSLWGKDLGDVSPLELGRGSKILAQPSATDGIAYYTYQTTSAAFPKVRYEFTDYGSSFLYATALQASNPQLVYSPEFLQYLTEEGFVRVTSASVTTGVIEYRHIGRKLKLYINAHKLKSSDTSDTGMVYIYPLYDQPGRQPALTSLDLGLMDFGTATPETVAEWEANHGGHYDAQFSTETIGIPFYFAEAPYYGRGYFFREGAAAADGTKPQVMVEKLYIWYDYSKFMYLYGNIPYPTAEFIALASQAGYQLYSFNPVYRWYLFYNANTGVIFLLRRTKLDKVYTSMHIYKPNATSAMRSLSARDLEAQISTRSYSSLATELSVR